MKTISIQGISDTNRNNILQLYNLIKNNKKLEREINLEIANLKHQIFGCQDENIPPSIVKAIREKIVDRLLESYAKERFIKNKDNHFRKDLNDCIQQLIRVNYDTEE